MAVLNCLVNGELTKSLSVNDRGFNYGQGVFETIAVVNKKLIFWAEHYKRLVVGCNALGISVPVESGLKNDITCLINDSCNKNAFVVKIIITRGDGERGYREPVKNDTNNVLILSNYPRYNKNYWSNGVSVKLCNTKLSHQQQLAGIKHLNRLEQVLARQEWDDEFQEGLMFDELGNLIEGVMSNVFIIENKTVITPFIKYAGVKGVMRQIVMGLCESRGITYKEDDVSLERLLSANEIFLTNSLIGIWPVKNVENTMYPVGKITKKITYDLFKEYLVDYATFSF